jgi:hypothetical protein
MYLVFLYFELLYKYVIFGVTICFSIFNGIQI